MRILIITDQFPPYYFGGMAQHAWHISHYLAGKHDVQVILPIDSSVDPTSVPFGIVPRLTMKFPRFDAIRALAVARKFNPDVIHVCTAGLAFLSLGEYYPIVTRVVGNDFLRPWCGGGLLLRSLYYRLPNARLKAYFKNRETRLRKRKVNLQLQKSEMVVANSTWTKDQLVKEGISTEKIATVVGGMDSDLFIPVHSKEELRNELGLKLNSITLVTAANLVGKKGIDTVIRALAILKDHYPSLEYFVLGDGNEEVKLKLLATELDIASCVHLIGRKTQPELCKYYQAADIYVQVSRNQRIHSGFVDVETMGRTYMEAGGCGISVIASRVGGVPSVVENGKNGLLVEDPEDVEEVAEKITTLLENPELRSLMGTEGVRLGKEKFSWESVGAVFEELLLASAKNGNAGYE